MHVLSKRNFSWIRCSIINMERYLFLLIFLLDFKILTCFYEHDNTGREFIIAFMENLGSTNTLAIQILTSTWEEIHVNVSSPNFFNPAVSEQLSFNKPSFQSLSLNNNLRLRENEMSPKGLLIQSDKEITVFGYNYESHSSDAFLALPTDALGTEYYTVTYYPPTQKCQIMMVGVYDNTTVTITLPDSADAGSISYNGSTYNKADKMTTTLNRYDTLQLQSSGDLTGSFINSDKHIAVFSGNLKTKVGNTGSSQDHLVIQLAPVDTWGKMFVIVPFPQRTCGDLLRIVSSQSATNITCLCSNAENSVRNDIWLENAGDFKQVNILSNDLCSISSNQPIMVVQILMSMDNDDTDPSMILVPPVEQFSSEHIFVVDNSNTFSNFNDHLFIFIIDKNQKNGLRVNGSPFPSNVTYTDIPNTNFVAGNINLNNGYYSVTHSSSTTAFSGTLYGKKKLQSYAFTTGRKMIRINKKCVPSTGTPGDGIDNNCNGLIDEDNCSVVDKEYTSEALEVICERNTKTLRCSSGYTLDIAYANYGRTSSITCGSHTRTDCLSQNTLDIVKNACVSKTSCVLEASNYVFGDPCSGISKYLEIKYRCRKDDGNDDGVADDDCSPTVVACTSCNRQKHWEVLLAEVSVLPTFAVYNVSSGNVGSCGKVCFLHESCWSFTYNHETGRCVGYIKNYMLYNPTRNIVHEKSKFIMAKKEFYFYSPSILEDQGFVVEKNASTAYKIDGSTKTKSEADHACALQDSCLFIIHSRTILDTMLISISNYLISDGGNARVYVAGHYNKGRWEFWNDQEVPEELWETFGADETRGHCVVLTNSGLKSQNCAEKLHFLCGK